MNLRDLRANISLFATTDTGTGGLFDVAVNGTNSPVHVIFPHAPADHVLALTAHTDTSPLDITLHPAFEGNFSVQGSQRSVAVHTAVEDPAGRGRRRQADWAQGPRWPQVGDVNGTVRWLPAERRQLGDVTASTLVGDVTLRL